MCEEAIVDAHVLRWCGNDEWRKGGNHKSTIFGSIYFYFYLFVIFIFPTVPVGISILTQPPRPAIQASKQARILGHGNPTSRGDWEGGWGGGGVWHLPLKRLIYFYNYFD
jgi:hypothetical protein